jgi:UDP:flavonoid glycosyltransferase YjiC (YdhE family)
LQRAGHDLVLAAPENFAHFVRDHGLRFHPLRGDVQQLMASETGRDFMGGGSANPIRAIRAMRSLLGPVALQMAEDGLAACADADALVSLAVFAPFGKSIAEIRGIPLINVEPTPLLPTRTFPAPGWPIQHTLGGLHNLLSGYGMLYAIWQWYGPFVNRFRQRYRLPAYGAADFPRILKSTLILGAYSPTVIPRPPDWPLDAHVTGYFFPEAEDDWAPPPALETFLAAGKPPVSIGFGSMAGRNPAHLAALAMEALRRTGQRGVLLTGWGAIEATTVPDTVLVMDAAPHSWFFPRMAAVVHHGGAGTTAEGLRAGVPSVIVPFAVDQPFWGKRVQALGLGPAPIPQKQLTADKLAYAVQRATTDHEIIERASAMGRTLRAEQGIENAVRTIETYLEG